MQEIKANILLRELYRHDLFYFPFPVDYEKFGMTQFGIWIDFITKLKKLEKKGTFVAGWLGFSVEFVELGPQIIRINALLVAAAAAIDVVGYC